MRKIPGPKPGSLVRYFPEELTDPADPAPPVVLIEAPSEAQKREAASEIVKWVEVRGPDAEVKLDYGEVEKRLEARLKRWVRGVENYVDAAGEPISTAEDLVQRGETAARVGIDIFIQRLLGLLPEEQKKSAGSSASSPAATRPLSGIAASAPAPDGGSAGTAEGALAASSTS